MMNEYVSHVYSNLNLQRSQKQKNVIITTVNRINREHFAFTLRLSLCRQNIYHSVLTIL